jgi:signal transduction protein with GAF and PtsI domain
VSEIREDLIPSVAAVRDLFGAAACSCALTDEQGEELTFVAADGAGAAEILGVRLPVRRGIAGWAAVSGQPLAVRDVGKDPRFAREVAESTSHLPEVVLVAPFFDRHGEVLGVLELLDPGVDVSGDWPLAVLGTLATQLAQIVQAVEPAAGGDRYSELGRRVAELVEDIRG